MEPAPASERVDFFVSYTHDDGWLDTKLRPLILQTVAGIADVPVAVDFYTRWRGGRARRRSRRARGPGR